MIRYWKIIFAVVAVLLLIGLLLVGAGLITGASPDRITELLYGGWDVLAGTFEAAKQEFLQLF